MPRAASSSSGWPARPQHEVGDAGLLVRRRAEHEAGEAERLEHPRAEGVGVVLAGDRVHDLGQHPVGGGGVVLDLRTDRPVEAPLRERLAPALVRVPLRGSQRGVREAGGVLEHVVEGDGVLAVRPELRDDVGHGLLRGDRALAEQLPDERRDERLGGREDREAGVDVGVAERLVHEHLAVEGEGHLAGGQQSVVDVRGERGRGARRRRSDRGWSWRER